METKYRVEINPNKFHQDIIDVKSNLGMANEVEKGEEEEEEEEEGVEEGGGYIKPKIISLHEMEMKK
jgi:hypothetical protein